MTRRLLLSLFVVLHVDDDCETDYEDQREAPQKQAKRLCFHPAGGKQAENQLLAIGVRALRDFDCLAEAERTGRGSNVMFDSEEGEGRPLHQAQMGVLLVD